jgi:cardiolipin synthase (CMP-forming)
MTSGKPLTEERLTDRLAEPRKDSIYTLPNLICFLRLFGALVLVGFALRGWANWFVAWFLFLSLTDLVDGPLARWLHQRSDFGARLDSFADLVLIAVFIFGASILCWERWQPEWIWVVVAGASYALATGVGIWKFRRVPSYHTLAAKATYGIALIAGLSLLINGPVWPLRFAALAVILVNLESTAITVVLKEWRADVLTLRHAWPKKSTSIPEQRFQSNEEKSPAEEDRR